ncbi:MAG: ATP-binding protein [Acidobacteriota bacterium]
MENQNSLFLEKKELELILNASDNIVLLLDDEGKIVRGNKTTDTWKLGQIEKMIGKHFHSYFHPRCYDKNCYLMTGWNNSWRNISTEKSYIFEGYDDHLNKFLKVKFRFISFDGEEGKKKTLLPVGRFIDITDEKKSEENVVQLLSELQAVINNLSSRYIKLDYSGKIINVKGRSEQSGDVCYNDHIGEKIYEIFDPEVNLKFKNAIDKINEGSKLEEFEHSIIFPSVGEQFIKIKNVRMSEEFILVIEENQTEIRRLLSIAQTTNMMKNLGVIFSGIRHEIGNPINTIKMTMSVLKDNFSDFSDKKKNEYIDRVADEIGRVEFLLKNLKNFNMYENLTYEKIDLNEFLTNFINLVKNDFQKEGVSIDTDFLKGKLCISIDTRALHQIMLNLVTNSFEALKYIDSPKITIHTKKNKNLVQIIIEDNGSGIPDENIKNIFNPFFTTKSSGTGLGLSIVKKIITQMGGSIEVISEEYKGTNFILFFPQTTK